MVDRFLVWMSTGLGATSSSKKTRRIPWRRTIPANLSRVPGNAAINAPAPFARRR